MPVVENEVVIKDVDIATVWRVLCDFAAFPALMDDVVAVTCFERRGDVMDSAWRVLLNGSELTWTERDRFIEFQEIRFHQLEGDLEVWEGVWQVRADGPDVIVALHVTFDLGIPSLAEILNPIGIRAIQANSRQMLDAIKGESRAAAA